MKVIRIDDEETKLTKQQKQKVALLKLTENGKYIENIGIKDNEFFLLTEDEDDEEYLAFMFLDKPLDTSLASNIKLLVLRGKELEILKVKATLKGEEPPSW